MNAAIVKVTAVILKSETDVVMQTLRGLGISHIFQTSGRTSILAEQRGLLRILSSQHSQIDEPVTILFCFAEQDSAAHLMLAIADSVNMDLPGRGSVFCEDFALDQSSLPAGAVFSGQSDQELSMKRLHSDLIGITCTVQRSEGDALARCVLEMGACVPTVTFGSGMGIRDKLGLLRVTIPAEKEIIQLVVHSHDAESVLEAMIKAGKLDQPGRGFIYVYPIKNGMLDAKITTNTMVQAASIEQIVATLDALTGSVDWRRNSATDAQSSNRQFLEGNDVSLICNEKYGDELIRAAMDCGAPGATIEKVLFLPTGEEDPSQNVAHAYVSCRMVLPENLVESVIEVWRKAGVFTEDSAAVALSRPITKAFTYIAKRSA